MITSVLLALVGFLFPVTVRAQYDGSANIQSVVGLTHSLDRSIAIAGPFTFIVSGRYSLGSMDIPNLNVYVAGYSYHILFRQHLSAVLADLGEFPANRVSEPPC